MDLETYKRLLTYCRNLYKTLELQFSFTSPPPPTDPIFLLKMEKYKWVS